MKHEEIAKELLDSYKEILKENLIDEKNLESIAVQCSVIAASRLIKATRSKLWYDVRHELLKIK
jgi:hypothetical protein